MTDYAAEARAARWAWRFGRMDTADARRMLTRSIDLLSEDANGLLTELGRTLPSDAMSKVRAAVQTPLGDAVRLNQAADIESGLASFQRAYRVYQEHSDLLTARRAAALVIEELDLFVAESELEPFGDFLPFCTLRAVFNQSALLTEKRLSHASHCAKWLHREFVYWCKGGETPTMSAREAVDEYLRVAELERVLHRLCNKSCFRLAEVIGQQHLRAEKVRMGESGHGNIEQN
ncbi:MAG: hypothetical protein AAF493_10990 [Pseudomonadota bacterium]